MLSGATRPLWRKGKDVTRARNPYDEDAPMKLTVDAQA